MLRNKNLIQFSVNFEGLHSRSRWHQLWQPKIASLTTQQFYLRAKETVGPTALKHRRNDVQRVYPSRLSSKLQVTGCISQPSERGTMATQGSRGANGNEKTALLFWVLAWLSCILLRLIAQTRVPATLCLHVSTLVSFHICGSSHYNVPLCHIVRNTLSLTQDVNHKLEQKV